MGRINFSRVVLGGVLAGILINISEYLRYDVVLRGEFEEGLRALGRGLPKGAAVTTVWTLWGFALGIAAVWLYAAIRPRYGPGRVRRSAPAWRSGSSRLCSRSSRCGPWDSSPSRPSRSCGRSSSAWRRRSPERGSTASRSREAAGSLAAGLQGLRQVLDQIVGVLEADRDAQQVLRRGRRGPSLEARCSIRLSVPPRTSSRRRRGGRARRRGPRPRGRRAPGTRACRRTPTSASSRHVVPGMRLAGPGSAPPRRSCSRASARRHGHRVLALRAHAAGERADAAQHQPGVERRGDAAEDVADVQRCVS